MAGNRGDRSTHATSELVGALVARHEHLRTHLVQARRGTADGVHRARVATRRLREIVPVIAHGLHGVRRRRLQRGLRALTRALGDVRECDVTLGLLEAVDTSSSPELDTVVRRCRARLRTRRREARAALGVAGEAADVRKLDTRLQRLILARRTTSDDTWRVLLARRVDARARRFRAQLEHAGVLYVIEPLHAVRIAGKRLRYALELVGQSGLAPVGRLLRQLTQVQDVLGRLHDLDVLVTHLRGTRAPDACATDATRAVEHLDDVLERERRSLHAVYLRRRTALIRLADGVCDDVVARVSGALQVGQEARTRVR